MHDALRPVPTDYPPFGSLMLIQALRGNGFDPYFYDIDGLRPSFDEVIRFYREQKPVTVNAKSMEPLRLGR